MKSSKKSNNPSDLTESSTFSGDAKKDEECSHVRNLISSTSETILEICNVVPSQQSTGAALEWFNSKLLFPYLCFLNIFGLRSPTTSEGRCNCKKYTFNFYRILILIIILVGYGLQYISCFQRSKGFGFKKKFELQYNVSCHNNIIFDYIIPYVLHFGAYIQALHSFSITGDDQLQCLMEKVFLFTNHLSESYRSRCKIKKFCLLFVICGLVWLLLSISTNIIIIVGTNVEFKWLQYNKTTALIAKILLPFCTIFHDAIQATVITNYCVQAQLLILYLHFLREKLLQYPVLPTEWIREFADFKELLDFLNKKLSPGVALFTLLNIIWAISSVFWSFHINYLNDDNIQTTGLSISNCIIWIMIATIPLLQAARLTSACEKITSIGHEIRTRPFMLQDLPDSKLDSILLYTSTLKLGAQLYKIPINGKYLFMCATSVIIFILVLGQLHFI